MTPGNWGARVLRAIAGIGICVLAVAGFAIAADRVFPPDLTRFDDISQTVVARDGRLLRAYLSDDQAWRFTVETADVSQTYIDMLIAVEDRRFFDHAGVDPFAILRAVADASTRGRVVSGASTLTMQVARLLEPRPRTLWSKIVEMGRALQLEWRYSKDEILRIYLTLAPFGGNLEGVRAASLAWFGKEPRHLTPGQAALLVALPQSPNAFRPDRAPDRAVARRNRILSIAAERDVLSDRRATEAQAEPIPTRRRDMTLLAGIATDRLVAEDQSSIVFSTLDYDLQVSSEEILGQSARLLGAGTGAAAIVAEIESGTIRALVGSADYLDPDRAGMVDQTRAVRSPGSALKPFIYAMAFDRFVAHPRTVIADRPRRFGAFAPVNFDRSWAGDVSLHDALRLSLNGPAVALLDRLGPQQLLNAFENAGTPLTLPPGTTSPGLAIALGGVGTTLEDLATLYAGLARGGASDPLRLAASSPEVPETGSSFLTNPAAAWYVTRSLSETPRPLAYRQDGHEGGRRIAFKTGTSHGYRDGWAIGYSGDFVVAVWVGRPDGAPCPGCSGIGAAAPAMFRLFDLLPADTHALLTAAAPAGAITGGPADLPVRLRHFDRRDTIMASLDGGGADGATAMHGPRFDFPVDGTEIMVAPALPVRIAGGIPPYRLLVDGAPVSGTVGRGGSVWRPDGPGRSILTVVDAEGRTARSRIDIVDP